MTNKIDKQTFGQKGAKYVGSGSATGEFCALQILEDATFSSLTWPELEGTFPTDVAISAGTVIYGQITAFGLTSGKVLAYKQV